MQYILTEEEYKKLTPLRNVEELEGKIQLLNDKVMILSNHPCSNEKKRIIVSFYCDDCPIGAFGTNTCKKYQRYSK
jgi:hypothetical protein